MAQKREEIKKKDLKYRCIGISNTCYNRQENRYYSVQFYDFDYHDDQNITSKELKSIANLFPYDLLMYRTKHGLHFVSFALMQGTYFAKAQAIELSKKFGNQDYWSSQNDLILRVSPKWEVSKIKKIYRIISKKPNFSRCLREPYYLKNLYYSSAHLEFYHEYLDLPDYYYYKYLEMPLLNCELKLYHYKARD